MKKLIWADLRHLKARRAVWARALASARNPNEQTLARNFLAWYDQRIAALNEIAPADADTSGEGMDNQTPAV